MVVVIFYKNSNKTELDGYVRIIFNADNKLMFSALLRVEISGKKTIFVHFCTGWSKQKRAFPITAVYPAEVADPLEVLQNISSC